uniref:Uncharacterized protein n=1 Tax=Oreochromis niloticus TaxID=8128 RepID=A0A669C7J3_ORENI
DLLRGVLWPLKKYFDTSLTLTRHVHQSAIRRTLLNMDVYDSIAKRKLLFIVPHLQENVLSTDDTKVDLFGLNEMHYVKIKFKHKSLPCKKKKKTGR